MDHGKEKEKEEEKKGGLSTGKVADGWVDCSVPIHRDTGRAGRVERRAADRGGQRAKERRSTYPCFHTGGTSDARYGASRPALAVYADAPCKLSRTVSSGTARYVIRPGTPNSLHGGALPVVVVLFAPAGRRRPRICSLLLHINARGCTSLAKRRRGSLSPSSFFLSSLIFYSSSSFFLFGGASRSSSAVSLSSVVHSYELKRGKERES